MTTQDRNSNAGLPPELHIDGAIATITLRRPAVANRLELSDLEVLQAQLAEVEARQEVLVLRLQGQGRHFCSGFYLGDAGTIGDRRLPDTNAVQTYIDLWHSGGRGREAAERKACRRGEKLSPIHRSSSVYDYSENETGRICACWARYSSITSCRMWLRSAPNSGRSWIDSSRG